MMPDKDTIESCFNCGAEIPRNESYYQVTVGRSTDGDGMDRPEAAGDYCVGCGPMKPE